MHPNESDMCNGERQRQVREHSKESWNLLLRISHNKTTVLLHQRKKKTLVRELCISYSKFSPNKKSPVCNIKEILVRKAASSTENSHKKSQFDIRVAWSGNGDAMRHFRPDPSLPSTSSQRASYTLGTHKADIAKFHTLKKP
jgi:hypothetical protein